MIFQIKYKIVNRIKMILLNNWNNILKTKFSSSNIKTIKHKIKIRFNNNTFKNRKTKFKIYSKICMKLKIHSLKGFKN